MVNVSKIIIEAVVEGSAEILKQPVPLWIKLLALMGAFSVTMTLLNHSGNLIIGIAYVIGFIKWFVEDVIGKFRK